MDTRVIPRALQVSRYFGISSQVTQSRFQQELTRQALEELDRIYGFHSEALRKLHAK